MRDNLLLLLLLSLLPLSQAVDCFGWSVTKRVSYMEVLPQLLYYDEVNWINLDAQRSCTFKSKQDVFLKLYGKDLTASY